MSFKTYSFVNRNTPQTEPLVGEKQVRNNAGGYVYEIDKWKAFERFLILGTEGGTFYVGERKLTKDAALNTVACIEADGKRAVDTIVRVSDEGRAAKNDPAIFALALASAAADKGTRQYALSQLSKVCRIPTHLFHFNGFVEQFRGRGRSLKTALREWYQAQEVDKLAYALVKYQQRDGWSHRDILRLIKPKPRNAAEDALFSWVCAGNEARKPDMPAIVDAFELAKTAKKETLIKLIADYNLSREMVPTELLKDPDVQWALLQKMPPHALLRNLGNLSKSGLLKPLSDAAFLVADKLSQYERLREKRVHPMDVITALKVYSSGHSLKGDGMWAPVQAVVDALDALFYESFQFIRPSGKRFLIGVDCSGSMTWHKMQNSPLTPRDGAAVMAMVIARAEKNSYINGFTSEFMELKITPRMRLDEVVNYMGRVDFGGTDCSVPMLHATANKLHVDCFVVLTDSETWAGSIHPSQALREYRSKSGIADAKHVVVGMEANPFTIADPKDPRTLDVVGFDTTTPAAISEFARS